jgi:hypothetical protein
MQYFSFPGRCNPKIAQKNVEIPQLNFLSQPIQTFSREPIMARFLIT